ncbi:hypothetical protein RRG08_012984 [Elysia crispata]|uniref:Uncharacterized protein n=1 Tax=Elysia crispata TaxID=231223 RepID=A0AAE1DQ91_9GAST|nr:hypothetical protein RRG08_012984 [Elysia crispata]
MTGQPDISDTPTEPEAIEANPLQFPANNGALIETIPSVTSQTDRLVDRVPPMPGLNILQRLSPAFDRTSDWLDRYEVSEHCRNIPRQNSFVT